MNEKNLIEYYNKFNEDKRLDTRHGIVEFTTITKYIDEYLKEMDNPKVIDIGAGTGKYSDYIEKLGYDVTAIELVKHNLSSIKERNKNIKAYQGNAIDLSRFENNTFDLVLLFGPLYHLINEEDKLKALSEAKRVVKPTGIIMAQYCLKDFAIIKHGFMDKTIKESNIDDNFNIISNPEDLYSFVTINEINSYNEKLNLTSIKRINPEGLVEYMRSSINDLDEEEFELFLKYNLSICEQPEMLGFGRHLLDIIKK